MRRPSPPDSRRRDIGLALAGGGFLGVAYEIGALAAIDESIAGLALGNLGVYVGVSAGAFVAAALANSVSPRRMAGIFIEGEAEAEAFDPAVLLQPDLAEISRAIRLLPSLAGRGLGTGFEDLGTGLRSTFLRAARRAGRLLPNGIFDAAPLERRLAQMLAVTGRTNDFRRLAAILRVVATDIETGEALAFGEPGFDDVPISRAVAASSAVPGLFKPVTIRGRHFVDGALTKTLHASVALREGTSLLLCVNPLVPFAATETRARRISTAGLPTLLAQSIRTAIRSRMAVGFEKYTHSHPDADIVVFEPRRDDASVFFTNMFSVSARRRLCEHAYQQTRIDLLARSASLAPTLSRHRLELDLDVLRDPRRKLLPARPTRRPATGTTSRALNTLSHTLDDLEAAIERRHSSAR